MQSLKGLNQKQLYLIISLVFFTIVFLSVYSVYYIQTCVGQEMKAEANKSKYHTLSEKIADLNNEKTDEVRKFIATGNMNYFDNYWKVIKEIKYTHDRMPDMQKDMITQESRYLNTALEDLTLLSYTDIRSMRLMADAVSINRDRLPSEIKDYVINIEEKRMSTSEKRQQALNLLFDKNYITEKNVIINNIESFQKFVDDRLNNQLNDAKKGVQTAIRLQSLLQIFFVTTFLGVLILLYLYNVQPIRSYTNMLTKAKEHNDAYELKPSGSFETKLLAEVFNQLYRSLVKANQAKSEFLSMISHELRTPLNSIIGYIFLLKRAKVTNQQKKYLDVIENSSHHLLLLINQILEFGKMEKGKVNVLLSSFDIRETLKSDMDMFVYNAEEKNIKLAFHCASQVPKYIHSDQRLINQMVINLLSNAVKFTFGGSVTLDVDFISPAETNIPGNLVIRVTDTGIGIKKENFEKIFEVFEQASPEISLKFGGSGLGLAITKNIVDALGGKIKVKSGSDKGTMFIISIPAESSEWLPEKRSDSISANQGKFHGIPVLLVEDNLINAKMEREILSILGFQVSTARTGREAMSFIDDRAFHFIFLDIRLPDCSGFQVADYARKSVLNDRTPIIALTANTEEVSDNRSKVINSYLSKPFETEKLVAVVDSANQNLVEKQTSTNDILNDQMPLRRIGGKKTLYLDMLALFLKDHGADDRKYHQFFLQSQYEACEFLIHSLKGVSGTIGAEQLAGICDQIRRKLKRLRDAGTASGKNGEMISRLNEDHRKMHDILKKTKQAVEKYINDHEAEKVTAVIQPTNKGTDKQTNEIMRELQEKISQADGYCYDFIDEHAEAIRRELPSAIYIQLRDALYRFDFQKAGEILGMEE